MTLQRLLRIHLSTALLLFFVASFLLYKNCERRVNGAFFSGNVGDSEDQLHRERICRRGWPFDLWFDIEQIPRGLSYEQERTALPIHISNEDGNWNLYKLSANSAIAFALLISIALFSEWFIANRQLDKQRQVLLFRLHKSTLGAMIVGVILLCALSAAGDVYSAGWPLKILSYARLNTPALILNIAAWLVLLGSLALFLEGELSASESKAAARRICILIILISFFGYWCVINGQVSKELVKNPNWYDTTRLVHRAGWPMRLIESHLNEMESADSRQIEGNLLFGTWNFAALLVDVFVALLLSFLPYIFLCVQSIQSSRIAVPKVEQKND